MHPRIREIIDTCKYHQGTVAEVGTFLPADDATLDAWIAEAVRQRDQGGFIYLTFAALHLGRAISSCHLAGAVWLLPEYTTLGCVAWKVTGDDVPEQLLAGVRHGGIDAEKRAGALLAAVVWCQERRAGAPLPVEIMAEVRRLARNPQLHHHAMGLLFALAQGLEDAHLARLLAHFDAQFKSKQVAVTLAEGLRANFLLRCHGPIFDLVRATENREHHGYTVRRLVARTGRNEPCPCGSGLKYKRCCVAKDAARWSQSTDVPGMTYAEVMASPEQHLTLARLEKAEGHQLARMDPRKLEPEIVGPFISRLNDLGMLEEAAQALEQLAWQEELREEWEFVLWTAAREGRKDVAERLLQARGELAPSPGELEPCVQLLLAREEPAALLRVLEELAQKALNTEESQTLEEIGYGILTSPLRAVGILIARGLIPITSKKDAAFLLNRILEGRDRLGLSPDDPYSDIIDKRFVDTEVRENDRPAAALRVAQRKLEAKAEEVRRMQANIKELHQEIERREKKAAAPASPVIPSAPVDFRTLQELREKVTYLKSALKERHEERSTLRRELEGALTDLDSLRAQAAAASPEEETESSADREEEWLLPGVVEGNQPVRLIEFPRKFQETLAQFPRPVSRGTMAMLGRLASGEPSAFLGVVRLKQCEAIWRVRIGIDHRLLFRLLPECVQVVDLINRQDFERRIKTL